MTAHESISARERAASSSDRPSRHAWLVAVSAGLGYLFDSYVVNIYSFVLPLIAASFALSSTAQGLIGSVLLAGYTVGTFGFGWAADRFGRRDTMGASILLDGVTTAASMCRCARMEVRRYRRHRFSGVRLAADPTDETASTGERDSSAACRSAVITPVR